MNALANHQPIPIGPTVSWLDAVRHAFSGLGAAVAASRRYEALSALTDEELAARGLDRTRVVEIVARSYLRSLARH